MEKIIKKFRLKAGAHTVLVKALQDSHIPFHEIENILPLSLWRDKKKLDEVIYLIYQELEENGITITNFERPEKKASDFSIRKHFPFSFLTEEQLTLAQRIIGPPIKASPIVPIIATDEVIIVASGGICVDIVDQQGRINRIRYFSEGEFFRLTDDFQSFAVTHDAFFWKFPEIKLEKFPRLAFEYFTIGIQKEAHTLKWIAAKTELNIHQRLVCSCEYIDEKFPDDHIQLKTDFDRSCVTYTTRESVTRRKNKPAQKRQ